MENPHYIKYLVSRDTDNFSSSNINKAAINQEHKERLIEMLQDSDYVEKTYPSSANFLLVKLQGIDAYELQEKLMAHKIMIRNCENFDFLDGGYVRIAVKELFKLERLGELL